MHDNNLVSVLNRREAVGDHDRGPVALDVDGVAIGRDTACSGLSGEGLGDVMELLA